MQTTPDVNGQHYTEWLADADYAHVFNGAGFDVWYTDNNFWKPRSDADWNGDGTVDDRDDVKVRNWWRDGQRAYYDRARAIAPSLKLMVNTDSDLSGEAYPAGADKFTQYAHVADFALIEGAMGKSWSVESWGGFAPLMKWYRSLATNLLDPGGVVVNVTLEANGYQAMRYALATTLLGDGYFAPSPTTGYGSVLWFDEFDLAGAGSTKWLGAALEPPPTAPFQNGVWRRRFEHGMALVNPKGNGAQSVTLEAGYRRIAGTQAPSVNDGKAAATVTLSDRDGLLLVAP